jgi:hypothetical protein
MRIVYQKMKSRIIRFIARLSKQKKPTQGWLKVILE